MVKSVGWDFGVVRATDLFRRRGVVLVLWDWVWDDWERGWWGFWGCGEKKCFCKFGWRNEVYW